MSEMRWVLLGGAAIVMAMLVAWTMQADTGPMPSVKRSAVSATSAQPDAPVDELNPGPPTGPARKVGGPVNLRATYGNPLAVQLHRDKMVVVEPPPAAPAP